MSPIESIISACVVIFLYFTVGAAMYFTAKMAGTDRSKLLSVMLACFVGVLMVFVVDKLSARSALLTSGESETVFTLVSNIMLIIIGYFFGSNAKDQK